MSLILTVRHGASSGAVTIVNVDFENSGSQAIPTYSGVRFGADGNMYKRQPGGGWSSIGAWLLNGTAGSYYLFRTVNSGSLSTDGGDDVIMSTNRDYDVQDSSPGFGGKSASVTFTISTTTGTITEAANPKALTFLADYEPPL